MRKSCLLVALMLVLMIRSSLSMTKCKKHELEALLKFKHSFTHDPQRLLSSWVGDDCCHWRGVGCDSVTRDVTKLNLRSPDGVDGVYTTSLVSSNLSSALLELRFLSHLDLSGNNFSGSRIPAFVGSMTHLRYLNFACALFSASFPPQLGNLTNLIHLDLSLLGNGYFTLKTEERLEWASSLSNLRYLDMDGNNISQAYDSLQVLFRLPSLLVLSISDCSLNNNDLSEFRTTNTSSLKHLDLSDNYLESSFPSFLSNMPCLESLSLNFNSFSGDVPIWLGNMTHLHILDLGQNKLNGSLPSQLGQLTKLNYLDLSYNEFIGPVPTSFAKLTALKYLDLSTNRLSGLIPDVLGPLTELETLDLSYNRLTGLKPDALLGPLTKLEYLDISSNSIQGTISHIGNLSRLYKLNMNFNNIKLNLGTNWQPPFQLGFLRVHSCQLNTAFPQWLRNQTQIREVDLSYTGISGELPRWLWNLTTHELKLAGNKLTGSLPRHIPCDGCGLDWLDFHNNMLSGTIPHWLKHLKTFSLLDLSENFLSGRIFETRNGSSLLSGTTFFTFLDLSNNMLSGEIQVKNAYSTDVQFLSLRGNDFSGLINSQLCNFTNLEILDLAHNRLTGHIPHCLGSIIFESGDGYESKTGMETQEIIKGTTENFYGTMIAHSMIDLSSNLLIGTIPEELANITNLMQLNLSNNRLTGGIPDDIGKLQLLESLDLSNNNLSGTIPQSLSNIPWLSVLNLSYNNLYGPIPTGRQLQSLADPSIYAGNSGLCGFPLPNTCTNSNSPPSPTDDDHGGEEDDDSGDKHDKLWLYLAVMYGVVTGFWVVVGTLVLKKRWRHAYFRFVEKTADRIYVPFKVRMNRFKTENSG